MAEYSKISSERMYRNQKQINGRIFLKSEKENHTKMAKSSHKSSTSFPLASLCKVTWYNVDFQDPYARGANKVKGRSWFAKESISHVLFPHARIDKSLRNSYWSALIFRLGKSLASPTMQRAWRQKLRADLTLCDNSLDCFKNKAESKVAAIVADVSDPWPHN